MFSSCDSFRDLNTRGSNKNLEDFFAAVNTNIHRQQQSALGKGCIDQSIWEARLDSRYWWLNTHSVNRVLYIQSVRRWNASGERRSSTWNLSALTVVFTEKSSCDLFSSNSSLSPLSLSLSSLAPLLLLPMNFSLSLSLSLSLSFCPIASAVVFSRIPMVPFRYFYLLFLRVSMQNDIN